MKQLESYRTGNTGRPAFSPFLLQAIEAAWSAASLHHDANEVRSGHLFEALVEGESLRLETYMEDRGFQTLDQLVGKAIPAFSEWGDLDLNYETIAKIDATTCIGCQLCLIACHDGAHQCIHPDPDSSVRVPVVDEDECVGCNLCEIVCPVPGCISLVEVDNGFGPGSWNQHVNDGAALRPKKGAH